MKSVYGPGEKIRKFIIANLDKHPGNIAGITATKFKCSRQAVSNHLQRLIAEGVISGTGNTRNKKYHLVPLTQWTQTYQEPSTLDEGAIWHQDISPFAVKLPENVRQILQYGFTEMLNNVIDHAEATLVSISVTKNAATTTIKIHDNGIGIFKKIQSAMRLQDERHAVLELAKGKFTTNPARHSGEGIFFSSRMFDRFAIYSGEVFFSHQFPEEEDWILQTNPLPQGTSVSMMISNHTARTTSKVFHQFTSDDDFSFSKTVVPIALASYGDDSLVSRSQAKRLLTRLDRFKTVILDFTDVQMIGQAFADEIFRVFSIEHPEVDIIPINDNKSVREMISRAKTHQ